MFVHFGDFDRTFALMDQIRRRMDRVWDDVDTNRPYFAGETASWPKINLYDTGTNLVLKADVPGLSEKDIQLTLNQDQLSINGERKIETQEGYSVHRQERSGLKFTRSLTLPCKVNPELTQATIKDGILTITLPKAVEAQPRQIAIKAQ